MRLNLALALLSSILFMYIKNELFFALAMVVAVSWMMIQGYVKRGIKIFCMYGLGYYISYLLLGISGFKSIGLFLSVFTHLLLPVSFMHGSRRSSGEVLSVFQKLHLPKAFGVSIIVLFRFIPTLKFEVSSIRTSLKYRGIGITPWSVLRHLVQNFKYTLVPLLIRTIHISEELTAAAMVRGVEMNNDIVSYKEVRFKKQDALLLVLYSALLLAIVCAERIGGCA